MYCRMTKSYGLQQMFYYKWAKRHESFLTRMSLKYLSDPVAILIDRFKIPGFPKITTRLSLWSNPCLSLSCFISLPPHQYKVFSQAIPHLRFTKYAMPFHTLWLFLPQLNTYFNVFELLICISPTRFHCQEIVLNESGHLSCQGEGKCSIFDISIWDDMRVHNLLYVYQCLMELLVISSP